jgi:hypothetical protein
LDGRGSTVNNFLRVQVPTDFFPIDIKGKEVNSSTLYSLL